MASVGDRLTLLRSKATAFTGVDFVDVFDPCTQTELRLFLVTDARQLTTPFRGTGKLRLEDITITADGDPNLPPIQVVQIFTDTDPTNPDSQVIFDAQTQRAFIRIQVDRPGTFARYRLRVSDPLANPDPSLAPFSRLDPFFNDVLFSFKVGCDDGQDCAPAPAACPPLPAVDFPVDYLARDFVSFRNALLDFASQRYPQWTLPIEADVGGMLAEMMAAVGDEFSYIQDRFAREAFLETATQRRTLRKKARLLDYEIHDGLAATTLLELGIAPQTDPATPVFVPAGSRVWALSESVGPIPFEVGLGLRDRDNSEPPKPTQYATAQAWNADQLIPYTFDDSETCLPVGATSVMVTKPAGAGPGSPVPNKPLLLEGPQRLVLLRTEPTDPGVPARRQFARLAALEDFVDPLADPNRIITRITWRAEDALPFQIDQTFLEVSLNVVPATAGETLTTSFLIRPQGFVPDGVGVAVEREGPLTESPEPASADEDDTDADEGDPAADIDRPPIFLFGLAATEQQGLGFLGPALRATAPEVLLTQIDAAGDIEWTWQQSLIGSAPGDVVFTLEDGVWRRIRSFHSIAGDFTHQDYATGAGFSIRFGDGEFGATPPAGQFQVTYRTGPGASANVPADAISAFSAPGTGPRNMPAEVATATNPQAVITGVDPELAKDIRTLTPAAFKATRLFALQPDDYGNQAEQLQFVQRARGTARWTGSWSSILVAADPFGSATLTTDEDDALRAWMDCVRQAGRDVVVRDPNTVPIDLEILICIERFAHAAEVVAQLNEVLLGPGTGRRLRGFFHPDNFTFGTPLRRAALEAAIQGVPGVLSVRSMSIRLRGVRAFRPFTELTLKVGDDQVLRLDNDPGHPEGGTLRLQTEGGA
jgi:hypothetical protein